jgi:hypothetical protein
MTRDEMLQKMGLSDQDHKELLVKFAAFHASLKPSQQEVLMRSMLPLDQAAKSFGPNVTVEHLQAIAASANVGTNGCTVSKSTANNTTNPPINE